MVECPICCMPVANSFPAKLAPFIEARGKVMDFDDVKAHHCTSCDYGFFTPSLREEHLARVYADYQGDEYNAQRIMFEGQYAEYAPSLRDKTNPLFAARRKLYDVALQEYREFQGIVMDFGGADGYYSNYAFPKAKVIIIEEGYERAGGDLIGALRRTDFLFATHVLEHLPDPYSVLSRLLRWIRPGVPVYLEVPISYVGSMASNFQRIKEEHERTGKHSWDQLVTMHEHVAHFSKRSVTTLLRRCGATPVEVYRAEPELLGVLAFNGKQRDWFAPIQQH